MTVLLDRIEDALAPLAADLVTSCLLCGSALVTMGGHNYGRAGIFCVCRECIEDLTRQTKAGGR
jgi:hypothetical protein